MDLGLIWNIYQRERERECLCKYVPVKRIYVLTYHHLRLWYRAWLYEYGPMNSSGVNVFLDNVLMNICLPAQLMEKGLVFEGSSERSR